MKQLMARTIEQDMTTSKGHEFSFASKQGYDWSYMLT